MNNQGLHSAPGSTFCGPTALAAVTGVSPESVEDAILAHRKIVPAARKNRKMNGARVKSMWSNEVTPVARTLGWLAYEAPTGLKSFAHWCRNNRDLTSAYVVLITGHFVAVRGGEFVDSLNRTPISLYKGIDKYSRRKVVRVWKLEEVK